MSVFSRRRSHCSFCGAPLNKDGVCSFLASGPADTLTAPLGAHQPTRGSDVEAWIKAMRDRHPRTPWWTTLDELLEDYRLRADTGLSLSAPIEESGAWGGPQP